MSRHLIPWSVVVAGVVVLASCSGGAGTVVAGGGAAPLGSAGSVPPPSIRTCRSEDNSSTSALQVLRRDGWVEFRGIERFPPDPGNLGLYSQSIVREVTSHGTGDKVGDGTLRVTSHDETLAAVERELPHADRIIGFAPTVKLQGADQLFLGSSFSVRPDGSAFSLVRCNLPLPERLRAYGESRGMHVAAGFPAVLLDELLADDAAVDRFEAWMAVAYAVPAGSVVPKSWVETPAGRRQVVPGGTPAEYLATLTRSSVVVKVPESWVPESGPIVYADRGQQLCLRTAAGYGQCRAFVRPMAVQDSYIVYREILDAPIEVVLLRGTSFDGEVQVVATVDGRRVGAEGAGVVLSGDLGSPTVEYT